jgi:HEAT repeat protein
VRGLARSSLGAALWALLAAILALCSASAEPDEARIRRLLAELATQATLRDQLELEHPDQAERAEARVQQTMDELVGLGVAAIPQLLDSLPTHSRRELVQYALLSLAKESPAGLAAVTSGLRLEHPKQRVGAAWALARLGQLSRPVVKELLRASRDEDAAVRREVAVALVDERQLSREVAPTLIRLCADPDASVRAEALTSLATLERSAALSGLSVVIRRLEDPDNWVREVSLMVLGDWSADSDGARAAVIEVLHMSHDAGSRADAARELGKLRRSRSQPALAPLTTALEKDPSGQVRSEAAAALGRLGKRASIPALIAALEDDPAWEAAATAIARIGSGAYPALLVELRDGTRRKRIGAACAIGEGLDAYDSKSMALLVPALLACMEDPEPRVRAYAVGALGTYSGQASPEVVSAIVAALEDEHREVRREAVWAAADLDYQEPVALGLSARLLEEDEVLSSDALGVLLDFDPKDLEPAIPSLVAAMQAKGATPGLGALLGSVGEQARLKGRLLWWIVPQVYWLELSTLGLLLLTWFSFAAWVQRREHFRGSKRLCFAGYTSAVASVVAGSAVGFVTSRHWAEFFLPTPFLSQLSAPQTAILSTVFLCCLAATWAASLGDQAEPDASPELRTTPPASELVADADAPGPDVDGEDVAGMNA